jgi:ABC-type lipoprotein export system ATPase subunit/histidinol phosphatase-like PHP family hydrolase
MSTLHEELLMVPRGADFVRADIHVHSFGSRGSYDVNDAAMSPVAIIDTAVKEGLGLISITDHNTIGNIEEAVKYAEGKDIAVIPGIEISTLQGHLLVYLPTLRDLDRFYGRLTISQDLRTCSQTMEQCLDLAGEFGGFGIAAHIDIDTGIERMMPRFDLFKEKVLAHRYLLGLEISSLAASNWYTDHDDSADRKHLRDLRLRSHNNDDAYELPKVMNSDAHSLAALGRNASGARKLTRIKLDFKSFDAFKTAFMDPTARVRIEDLIPNDIPQFVGMKLAGGFLDGQTIRFSKNLTCIIGGRGTGKSTMLESLRAAAGSTVHSSVLDSDVWPDDIRLMYRDQAGRDQILSRSKLGSVTNLTHPRDGITKLPIESYGQGETAETIQHCDKNPAVLLKFLDDFVNLDQYVVDDDQLRDELLKNQTHIERLRLDVNTLPDVMKAKAHAEAQLNTLKEKDAAAVAELEEKLARGRRFKADLVAKLGMQFKTYREALAADGLSELIEGLDGTQLVVGKAEFDRVKSLVEGYAQKIKDLASDVKTASKETIDQVNEALREWAVKEAEVQGQIDTIRKELEGRSIKLDLTFIRKVAKDVTDFTAKVSDLKLKETTLAKALEDRKDMLRQRRELKSRMHVVRSAFASQLNAQLKSTVVDYFVTLRYHEGVLSSELEMIIKDALGWRTSQVPRASLIAASLSPFQLLDAITRGDTTKLTSIRDADGQQVFTISEARTILTSLNSEPVRHSIERCRFDDRPEISVTKEMDGPGGKTYVRRDFSKLSLGQQQSVLLSILLFSDSNEPLVIDQPEDNLDSEFIYKTFVRCLRKVKEKRQVIIVTHNANIAVLGDAELIIPLRATSDKSVIRDRGSIDNAATKDLTCTILEGSIEAFKKRQLMYRH